MSSFFTRFTRQLILFVVLMNAVGFVFCAQMPSSHNQRSWSELSPEEQAYHRSQALIWKDSFFAERDLIEKMKDVSLELSQQWSGLWVEMQILRLPLRPLDCEYKNLCKPGANLSPEELRLKGLKRRQIENKIKALETELEVDKKLSELQSKKMDVINAWNFAESLFMDSLPPCLVSGFWPIKYTFEDPAPPCEKIKSPVSIGRFNAWICLDARMRCGKSPAYKIAQAASVGCPEALALLGFDGQAAQNGHKLLCLEQGNYWFNLLTNGKVAEKDIFTAYHWYKKILNQPIRYINYDNELKISSHVGALLPVHPEDLKCYTRAAHSVGVMCFLRTGVPPHEANDQSALKYFSWAASFNYTPAVWSTVGLKLVLERVPECNISRCKANFRHGLYLIKSFMRDPSGIDKNHLQKACVMLIELCRYFGTYVPYTTTYFDKISKLASGVLQKIGMSPVGMSSVGMSFERLAPVIRKQIQILLAPKIIQPEHPADAIFNLPSDHEIENRLLLKPGASPSGDGSTSSPRALVPNIARHPKSNNLQPVAVDAVAATSLVHVEQKKQKRKRSKYSTGPATGPVEKQASQKPLVLDPVKDTMPVEKKIDKVELKVIFASGKKLFENMEYDQAYSNVRQAIEAGYSPKISEYEFLARLCYKAKHFGESRSWADKLKNKKISLWFNGICLLMDESCGESRIDEAVIFFEQIFPLGGADFTSDELFDFDENCLVLRSNMNNVRVLGLLVRICFSFGQKSICGIDVEHLIGAFCKFGSESEEGFAKILKTFIEYKKQPNSKSVNDLYQLLQSGELHGYLNDEVLEILNKITSPLVSFFNKDLFEIISIEEVKQIDMEPAIYACYLLSIYCLSTDTLHAAQFFAVAEFGSFIVYSKKLCSLGSCLNEASERSKFALMSKLETSDDPDVVISALCLSNFFRFMLCNVSEDVAGSDCKKIVSMLPKIAVLGKKIKAKKNDRNIIFANTLNMCSAVGDVLKMNRSELIAILRKACSLCEHKAARLSYNLGYALSSEDATESEMLEALCLLEKLRKKNYVAATDLLGCLYSPSISCGGKFMLARKDIKKSVEYWREAIRGGCPAPVDRFYEHMRSTSVFLENVELVEDFIQVSGLDKFGSFRLRISVLAKILTSPDHINSPMAKSYGKRALDLIGEIKKLEHTNREELETKAWAILQAASIYICFRNYESVAKMLKCYIDLTENIFLNVDDQMAFGALLKTLFLAKAQNPSLAGQLSEIVKRVGCIFGFDYLP